MPSKKILSVLCLLVTAGIFAGCGVQKLRQLKITSWTIESVSLRGLRSLEAGMTLGIDNPGTKVTLEDISGIIFYKGEEFLHYTAEPLTLEPRRTAEYPCRCILNIDDSKSILDVLAALPGYSPEFITTDLSAKVRVNGILSKNVSFKNIPIERLIGRVKKQSEKNESV